jgi:hypothetical protein
VAKALARSQALRDRLATRGHPTECTVVEANIVNQWDDSKNSYVIQWTDGTKQAIGGPYNAHPLDRNPATARQARALSNPAVVAEPGPSRSHASDEAGPARSRVAGLQPTEAELDKLLAGVRD